MQLVDLPAWLYWGQSHRSAVHGLSRAVAAPWPTAPPDVRSMALCTDTALNTTTVAICHVLRLNRVRQQKTGCTY